MRACEVEEWEVFVVRIDGDGEDRRLKRNGAESEDLFI